MRASLKPGGLACACTSRAPGEMPAMHSSPAATGWAVCRHLPRCTTGVCRRHQASACCQGTGRGGQRVNAVAQAPVGVRRGAASAATRPPVVENFSPPAHDLADHSVHVRGGVACAGAAARPALRGGPPWSWRACATLTIPLRAGRAANRQTSHPAVAGAGLCVCTPGKHHAHTLLLSC
jgi:hypothetical protein